MKTIPQNIVEVFPNAKYIESTDWLVEDDIIELTKKLHIQVSLQSDFYSLVKEKKGSDGLIFEYLLADKDLNKIYRKAIEVATCRSLN